MDFADKLNNTASNALKSLEKIGVHVKSAELGTVPKDPAKMLDPEFVEMVTSGDKEEELFESGELRILMRVVAHTADLAFSEKILDPEMHELNQEFRMQLPTEDEVNLGMMSEDLDAALAELDEDDD